VPPIYSFLPARCAADPRLTASHFRVLAYIGAHTRKGTPWRLNQRSVGHALDIRRETVNRKIKDLVEWGYIQKSTSASPFGSLSYYVLIETKSPPSEARNDQATTSAPCDLVTSTSQRVDDDGPPGDESDHSRCDRKRAQQERSSLNDQDSPQPPDGGLSGKLRNAQGRASLLATLRQTVRHSDAIEHLIAPLLASDQRLALGKEPLKALNELAEAASGIPPCALAAAVERLRSNPRKLTKLHIQNEINVARKSGAMIVIRPGMPEWQAWRAHFAAYDPKYLNFMDSQGTLQVPSQWPPKTQEGAA
jgi:hypothetical protein